MTLASTGPRIGRARELDCFQTFVEAIRSGSAATLLIEGEAGIGKTRLTSAAHRVIPFASRSDAFSLGRTCWPLAIWRRDSPVTFVYHLDGRALREGNTEILHDVDSLDVPRVKRACAELERMAKELGGWGEIAELRSIYRDWEGLHEKVVGAMEDITLRQLVPGRCNWCPVES
jgi:hypothetical protein